MTLDRIRLLIIFSNYDIDSLSSSKRQSFCQYVVTRIETYAKRGQFELTDVVMASESKRSFGISIGFYSDVNEKQVRSRLPISEIQAEVGQIAKNEFGKKFRFHDAVFGGYDAVEGVPDPTEAVKQTEDSDNDFVKKAAERFIPIDPFYTFDQLIVNQHTLDEIEAALAVLEYRKLVFEEWGLSEIEPFPRAVLNFYGPPGTGKTLAAHAIANKLGKKLLIIGCPEIESKYHGEGPKNVQAVFYAAKKHDAILFFDEADAVLSKRLEEVHSGIESEINHVRNAMLTCLEQHEGIVIMASNLIQSYDHALETRIQSVEFPLPDAQALTFIWKKHVPDRIPLVEPLDFEALAAYTIKMEFCGRDVKNAVIKACITAALNGCNALDQQNLLNVCDKIMVSRESVKKYGKPSKNGKTANMPDASVKTLSAYITDDADNFKKYYLSEFPLASDIDASALAEMAIGLGSSDIKEAIKSACYTAVKNNKTELSQRMLYDAFKTAHKLRAKDGETDIMTVLKPFLEGGEVNTLQIH